MEKRKGLSGNQFHCEYPEWTYDLRGALTGSPYEDGNDMVAAYEREPADDSIVIGGTRMNVFPNLVVLGQQQNIDAGDQNTT